MALVRWALVLLGSIGTLLVLAVVSAIIELSYTPSYDRSGADYERYAGIFARLEQDLGRDAPATDHAVDVSQLNGGEWTTVCIFGGYTDPVTTMRSLNADIEAGEDKRFAEAAHHGFRLAPVEEYELVLAYIDPRNHARFIWFERGIGPHGKRFQQCISKPATQLVVRLI